jgi:anti-anti-sigma factor
MSPRSSHPPLRVEQAEDALVVRVTTEHLGEEHARAVAEELSELASRGPGLRLCLDLARVRYLTSTGLNQCVALHNRLRSAGGQLILANATGLVYEAFDVTRLTRLLDVRRRGESDALSPSGPRPLAP